jgi:hypothetical protein|tara:strand:- start:86 stop:466 length:381 start_codon:yes stop_codon:yes gene_type:complete
MNILMLLQRATKRLETNDPVYHEQADTAVAILRSAGALPSKRASVNGGLHKLVAAALVEAYEADTTVDVGTRSAGLYNHYGYSTKIISYLDKMVQTNLLSATSGNRAKGKLVLGNVLDTYLSNVPA